MICVGRDSSVGMASRYYLNGLEIEKKYPGVVKFFCTRPGRYWDPTHLRVKWVPVFFPPWIKCSRRGVNHPHPSSTEVKERVEL
jgi:hypothetical protein